MFKFGDKFSSKLRLDLRSIYYMHVCTDDLFIVCKNASVCRLKGLLVRVSIYVGLAIYVKQCFFDGSAEANEMAAQCKGEIYNKNLNRALI